MCIAHPLGKVADSSADFGVGGCLAGPTSGTGHHRNRCGVQRAQGRCEGFGAELSSGLQHQCPEDCACTGPFLDSQGPGSHVHAASI